MCVSLQPAALTNTIVGVYEDSNGRRYLAYQNTVASLAANTQPVAANTQSPAAVPGQWTFDDLPSAAVDFRAGGNAMILPIPAEVADIEVLDTSAYSHFLKDIREALIPPVAMSRGTLSFGAGQQMVRVISFDIYTIVIAANAQAIATVINSDAVPEQCRPALNDDIVEAYTGWYPGWAIAVCCFNNGEAQEAKPLLFSYRPTRQDPDYFFIPTLDCHDGGVPDLTAMVEVDHTIFVACNGMDGPLAYWVDYSDAAAEPLRRSGALPAKVVGRQLRGTMRNGDIVFRRCDLEAGQFRGLRALPPGAREEVERVFI